MMRARAAIEITDLQRRAVNRFLNEETLKQENIENITQKALSGLSEDSRPEDIQKDWIINFFDKARLVSDVEMQQLWARVLAGEANQPSFCSKRTINVLASMDKAEAELFRNFCTFVWDVQGLTPLIFDTRHPIYNEAGVFFDTLQHLELTGVIKFDASGGFVRLEMPDEVVVRYFDRSYKIKTSPLYNNKFPLGNVVFTAPGQELALVSGSMPNPAFLKYVLEQWRSLEPSAA